MTSGDLRRLYRICLLASITTIALAPIPARAEFFNDVQKTFQTDIPHFFQDDIPCAFGGQPTSHTRTSCKGKSGPNQPLHAGPPTQPMSPTQTAPTTATTQPAPSAPDTVQGGNTYRY